MNNESIGDCLANEDALLTSKLGVLSFKSHHVNTTIQNPKNNKGMITKEKQALYHKRQRKQCNVLRETVYAIFNITKLLARFTISTGFCIAQCPKCNF